MRSRHSRVLRRLLRFVAAPAGFAAVCGLALAQVAGDNDTPNPTSAPPSDSATATPSTPPQPAAKSPTKTAASKKTPEDTKTTAAKGSSKEPASPAAAGAEEDDSKTSETAPTAADKPADAKGSPQHFEPTEKVRPDFDVAFPVDI